MHRQEREQALAKTALALMGDCDVTPTPDNFELFYTYASGENPAIARIIGDMVSERRPFTSVILRELRSRCLTTERTAEAVEAVSTTVATTLTTVLGKLEEAGKDASDYGKALSAASGELGDQQSPADLRKLVDGLMSATRSMEARTKNLEVELQRSSQQVGELKVQLDDVRKQSLTDPLTGISNRKAFDTELQAAIDDAHEHGEPMALLMCDIDRFKTFNDTWGHQTGDQVLRLVANCMSENVKGRDTAARYGGEEFAVILRQTSLEDAVRLADKIRGNVQGKKLVKKSTGDILGTITISIGVASFAPGESSSTLVQRADMCLYDAKHAGRNRVVGENDQAAGVEIDAA